MSGCRRATRKQRCTARYHYYQITDAQLIALAVAQMFIGIPNDRKFPATGVDPILT